VALDHMVNNYGCSLLGLLYLDPTTYTGNNAYPMYGAPATVNAMFVTPERFIFALGSTTNYLLMQWPDRIIIILGQHCRQIQQIVEHFR